LAKDFIIEQLKLTFQGRDSFTREELWDFYRQYEPDLLDGTLGWRIYHLKEKKIIRSTKKGIYTLSYKPVYKAEVDNKSKELFLKLSRHFDELKACVWSTRLLNEFMLHIPGKSSIILEIENEAIDNVFYFLKDANIKNLFLQPTGKEIDFYINDIDSPIVIKSLVTKSPLQKQNKVSIPTLEKILVDIYVEKQLFNTFQGSELSYIFNSAYNKYEINFSRLLSYAKRRGKEKEIIHFMNEKTDIANTLFE
jgi:hypothetical protein